MSPTDPPVFAFPSIRNYQLVPPCTVFFHGFSWFLNSSPQAHIADTLPTKLGPKSMWPCTSDSSPATSWKLELISFCCHNWLCGAGLPGTHKAEPRALCVPGKQCTYWAASSASVCVLFNVRLKTQLRIFGFSCQALAMLENRNVEDEVISWYRIIAK